MSMQGEIMEEMYDKKVQEFLKYLTTLDADNHTSWGLLIRIVEEYKSHFKNMGVYGN